MPQTYALLVTDTGMFPEMCITAHLNGTHRSRPQPAPSSVASAFATARGNDYLVQGPETSLRDDADLQQLKEIGDITGTTCSIFLSRIR